MAGQGARPRDALLAAARPLARAFLDLSLPDERVVGEIQRLVANLVAMHELLRDARHASIRLVMTPDRMVVAEAMRTFTYLNLYGYLTDAVVVNRVFPDAGRRTYFGAWREVQAEQLELVDSGFAPVPVLRAPYFEREVLGAEMLDRLAGELFADGDPAAVLHDRVSQELTLDDERAELRLDLPFVAQGRRLAEEDRARAGRARRRPQAHDHAAGRAGRATGRARRRSPTARWSSASRRRSRSVPDPLDAVREAERLVREATERAEAIARAGIPPRGFEAPGARTRRAPRSRTSRRWPGCSSWRAGRCRRSWRASWPRRCASC